MPATAALAAATVAVTEKLPRWRRGGSGRGGGGGRRARARRLRDQPNVRLARGRGGRDGPPKQRPPDSHRRHVDSLHLPADRVARRGWAREAVVSVLVMSVLRVVRCILVGTVAGVFTPRRICMDEPLLAATHPPCR